ncbi:MAG: PilC/PilY family type IV pilus protein [Oleibacter sp.]|nr:PilC/PilY family type IV pilus protein [Thalassolituus sp.]
MKKLLPIVAGITAGSLALLSAADDTEVFVGAGGDATPNILMVLDTSLSMSKTANGANAEPYVSTTVYDDSRFGFEPNALYVYNTYKRNETRYPKIPSVLTMTVDATSAYWIKKYKVHSDLVNNPVVRCDVSLSDTKSQNSYMSGDTISTILGRQGYYVGEWVFWKAKDFPADSHGWSAPYYIDEMYEFYEKSNGYDYLAYEDPYEAVKLLTDIPGVNSQLFGNTSIDGLPVVDTKDGSSRILQCIQSKSGSNNDYSYSGSNFEYLSNNSANSPYSNSSSNRHSDSYRYNILVSGNYLNYLSYIQELRIDVLRRAVKDVVENATGINVGVMRFDESGGGGFIDVGIDDVNTTGTDIVKRVNLYGTDGLTPLAETLYESYLYLSGQEPKYGDNADNSIVWSTLPNPNGFSDYRKTNAFDARISNTVMTNAGTSSARYIAPDALSCTPTKLILFSDGDPTGDAGADSEIEDLIEDRISYAGLSSEGYSGNADCSARGNGECGDELAFLMANTNIRNDLTGIQTATLDTIGGFLDRNVSKEKDAIDYLQTLAAAGNGTYYSADKYEDIVTALNNSFRNIKEDPTSFISPTVAVSSYNSLKVTDEIYYTVFQPSATTAWKGNLKRYKLGSTAEVLADIGQDYDPDNGESQNYAEGPAVDPNTGFFKLEARSYWSETADGYFVQQGGMANRLTADRKILTRTSGTTLTSISSPVSRASTITEQNSHISNSLKSTVLSKSLLGITGESDATQAELIEWIAGLKRETNDAGNTTLTARKELEDPLHSQPLVINYEAGKRVLFMGTNSGYLHAFNIEWGDSAAEQTAGEIFSFIPRELLKNPKYYFAPESSFDKIYGMDGQLSYYHKDDNFNGIVDGSDKLYLYAGMRRGGSSYYALDITDPTNPSFVWQINGPYQTTVQNVPSTTSGFSRLGQTWSKMNVAQVRWGNSNKVVLIFSGGYDIDNDDETVNSPDDIGNTLYMVDAETGALLWDASSNATLNGDMDHSFAADPVILDRDRNGIADLIYAADTGGQVWRFDLTQSGSVDSSNFASGYVIADLAGTGETADIRFLSSPDVTYLDYNNYSSGYPSEDAATDWDSQAYIMLSIGSGNRADPLDTSVQNYHFLIKDVFGTRYPTTAPAALSLSDLKAWGSGDSTYGWYIRLPTSGEKSLFKSATLSGELYFTTYAPTALEEEAICGGNSGTSKLYRVNLKTPDRLAESKTSNQPYFPGNPVLIPLPDGDGTSGDNKEYGVIVGTERQNTQTFFGNSLKNYWREQRN